MTLTKVYDEIVDFIAAGSRSRIDPIADALRALLKQTFDAWTPLAQWAGVPDLLRRNGYLVVYESDQALRGDALAWKIRRDRGVICEELDALRIREMEPALRGIYQAGMFLPEQGYVANPLRLTQALAAQFERDGGHLLRRKVLDIEIGAHGPQALLTDAGRMPVETLVICAGVHSNEFSAKLGSDVPLESQRGYHVHYEQPTVTLQRPVMSGEGKFFATPMEHGLRVAGAVEFAGTTAPPNAARTVALRLQADRMLPELSGSATTEWMGHRPCMPDSLPVIGPSPRFANSYFAFGHGHVGLCGGAPTGRLIAELIAGRKPNIDIAPFRADRF